MIFSTYIINLEFDNYFWNANVDGNFYLKSPMKEMGWHITLYFPDNA